MMLATTNGPDCFSCSLQIRRWRWRGGTTSDRGRLCPRRITRRMGSRRRRDGIIARSLARGRLPFPSPKVERKKREEKEEVEGRRRGESLESGAKKEREISSTGGDRYSPACPSCLSLSAAIGGRGAPIGGGNRNGPALPPYRLGGLGGLAASLSLVRSEILFSLQ